MSMLTVRSLDPEVKAKLRERAARRGRSMEAEVREILAQAVAVDDAQSSLADIIMERFSGVEVALDLPDRSADTQRHVDL